MRAFLARVRADDAAWLRDLVALVLLVPCVVLAYLPSLPGGFLNLDDPWLIQYNEVFHAPSWRALGSIWTDLSPAVRLSLGAEYLPIRDTSVWLDARFDGLSPLVMRLGNLCAYLVALGLLRGAVRRALGRSLALELAIFVFALHPVHVESVAWLAGRKDVLALLFVAWALYVHAGEARLRPLLVPVLLSCAYLAKAQSVIAVALLFAHDLLARRRPGARIYAPVLATAALAAGLHAHVGNSVHMLAKLAGGSHFTAALTMGGIVSRYLGNLLWPLRLSVVYDAPATFRLSVASVFGYGLLLVWGALGFWAWRRGRTALVLAAFIWFLAPLLPVSQVLFPLQNRMADRYLLFSVFALALVLAWLFQEIRGRFASLALAGAGALLLALGLLTFERTRLFADSAALFEDATRKTKLSALAPLQWALALEALPDPVAAEQAYLEVLKRSSRPTEPGRRATNNLARAYARAGRLDEANRLLLRGRALWPNDPKVLYNLAVVSARRGDQEGALALASELQQRFPDFHPGQSSSADFYSSP